MSDVADPSQYRLCNTNDLRVLARKVGAGGIDPGLNATLDPEGTHVLHITLWGHNMDASDNLQHKVKVLARVIGTTEPAEFTFVMEDTDWKRLATLSEAGL